MNDDGQNIAQPPVLRRWRTVYIAGIIVVSLPYAISFTSQLCSDDFILLYYYGVRPLWRIGVFFLPRTLWTYHPLQDFYVALGWHISGIEPWGYRALSLAIHFGTALLLMEFGRGLTGSIHVGGCAAIVFAGFWWQWEAISWAASAATTESTFFCILTCVAFLSFLQRRRRAAYVGMIFAVVGWFFSKETIIQLPLFLTAIYVYQRWSVLECGGPIGPIRPISPIEPPHSKILPDLARLLAVPVAIVVVYLIFYALFVHNTYTFAKLGYETAPVNKWPANAITWLDYSCNPLLGNEIVNTLGGRRIMRIIHQIAHWHLVAAATLLLIAYFTVIRRRMLPLFALGMMTIAMIPYLALRTPYFGNRYYYGVMLGGSLLVVSLAREMWRTTAGKRGGWHSSIRIVVAATGGLWIVAHFVQLAQTTLHDRHANRTARELYDFLASQTDKADRSVLFIVDTTPVKDEVDVELGWGLLECARVALRSDTVAAVELGFDLERSLLKDFNGCREKYLVLRKETGWAITRLPDNSRLTIAPNGHGGVVLEKGTP